MTPPSPSGTVIIEVIPSQSPTTTPRPAATPSMCANTTSPASSIFRADVVAVEAARAGPEPEPVVVEPGVDLGHALRAREDIVECRDLDRDRRHAIS